MATIKDIAKKLNISVSTVSYVMNDGPRNVPDDVKKRVLETARELGYRPNRIAKTLVTQRANVIGIVPSEPQFDTMVGPYLRTVFNVVLNVAEEENQDVLFMTTHAQRDPELYANSVLDGRIDGALLIGADSRKELIEILVERKFPHVLINTHCSPESTVLTVDNEAGVVMLMEHLFELGHRKFGIVKGMPEHGDSMLREQAFDRFVTERGCESRPEWRSFGYLTTPGGAAAMTEIWAGDAKPTAIFAANDESALGALRAARQQGLQVPADLSIVGFDDTEWVRETDLSITTVAQNEAVIAAEATRALLKLVKGEDVESRTFMPELRVRASTGIVR